VLNSANLRYVLIRRSFLSTLSADKSLVVALIAERLPIDASSTNDGAARSSA